MQVPSMMAESAGHVVMLARLTRDLPGLLRRPISLEQARASIRERLRTRERRFLTILDRAIYRHPTSPYARLLRNAGCTYGDIVALVRAEGVEGALRQLADRGVYVTLDELKGRHEAVRGSQRFAFSAEQFDNPLVRPQFVRYTSGTRGRPSRVGWSLAWMRELAEIDACTFEAFGLHAPRHAFLSAAPFHRLFAYAALGQPVAAWHYPVAPIPLRARAYGRYVAAITSLMGYPVPAPTYRGVEHAAAVARELADLSRGGRQTVVYTVTSTAARIAGAAAQAGISLHGVAFLAVGEPMTEARKQLLEEVGAQTIVSYGSVEVSTLGNGCPAATVADDVHLFHDQAALTARQRPVFEDGPLVDALLVSTLSLHGGKILLNGELGDTATVEERDSRCCNLGALGFTTHVSGIRSFEKMSTEGVSFARSHLDQILEEALPARFGGTAIDYQLVEYEAIDEREARLILRVHPAIQLASEAEVKAAFLAELGRESLVDRHQARLLERANAIQVSREPPLATPRGKILPFQVVAPPSG